MPNDSKVFKDVPFYSSTQEMIRDLRVGDYVQADLGSPYYHMFRVVGVVANGVIGVCEDYKGGYVIKFSEIVTVCKVKRNGE